MLGNECNLSCEYCMQHDIVNDQMQHTVNKDVVKYIIDNAAQQETPIDVRFYGGEPLLFFDNIKYFVQELHDKNVVFSAISNGRLLTRDIVDFINKYNISFGISWDGKNVEETRHYDVLKEKKDLILQLNRMCLSGVISSKNYIKDFLDQLEELNKQYIKIHKYHMGHSIDEVMDICGNCSELSVIDTDKMRKQSELMCENFKKDVQNNVADMFNKVPNIFIMTQMERINNIKKSPNNATCRCGNGLRVLNVDMKGDLYLCHNTHVKVGTIYDNPWTPILNTIEHDNTKQFHAAKCHDCEILEHCSNGCMLMGQDIRDRYYCDLKKAIHGPIVKLTKELLLLGEENNGSIFKEK